MNERIKELAEQAGITNRANISRWHDENCKEKK
jgi:hypothetical protein